MGLFSLISTANRFIWDDILALNQNQITNAYKFESSYIIINIFDLNEKHEVCKYLN